LNRTYHIKEGKVGQRHAKVDDDVGVAVAVDGVGMGMRYVSLQDQNQIGNLEGYDEMR
jgi:hypothetical protein